MKEILPGLFLGNLSDTLDIQRLHENKIKVILSSINEHDPPANLKNEFICKNYPLIDDGTDNLLRFVDEFAEDADKYLSEKSNTLLHCAQGVSRSVGLVTGYLMKKQKLDFEECYSFVKRVYHAANIADNFREQLTIYGSLLSWDARLNSQQHRLYRAKHNLCLSIAHGVTDTEPKLRYLCRKCRQCLFLDTHILPLNHSNMIIECMQWMDIQSVEGPIVCSRCHAKIGYYNWSGSADNAFDGPVFIMTKSKIDEMPLTSKHFGDSFPLTRF
jgi:dual specificity phosphatase 12